MKVAVLGTGSVGQALAGRLAELGHEVTMGTRDPAATLARTDADGTGGSPVAGWLAEHPDVALAGFSDAVRDAEIVVNATSGRTTLDALADADAGAGNLDDTVLIDVANPLDFSQGFPPTLLVKDTDSLGEQVQAAFPRARVVKALNTMAAELMVHPRALADGDHSTFVCGNDAEAKRVVCGLLADLGHTDVIDLGDISGARGTEMYLPLWLRTMGALGTGMFNVKVVR